MIKFKHTLFVVAIVSLFVLTFSSCYKEKTTKWKCVLYGTCNVGLIMDNETDLAYVTVDYLEGNGPNPRFLFFNNTTYKKIGDTFRRVNPATCALESPGFVITYLSYEFMDLEAIDYLEDDNDSTFYVTKYYFTRVL